jgi:hypothetical protein
VDGAAVRNSDLGIAVLASVLVAVLHYDMDTRRMPLWKSFVCFTYCMIGRRARTILYILVGYFLFLVVEIVTITCDWRNWSFESVVCVVLQRIGPAASSLQLAPLSKDRR